MDKSSIASAILAAYPQNFKEQIAGVDVSELSAKYKLKPAGKNQVYNVTVRIKSSAFYPTGESFVLCKAFADSLYLSVSQQVVPLSSPELSQLLVAETNKIFSSTSTFGCCALYQECSDENRCIHQNPFYSNGCTYRHNLEAGRNFYRKKDT